MAAFIRDRDARHKFRNKYKRLSKFRKLRDDNRILFSHNIRLFKENKEIFKRLNAIQNQFTKRNVFRFNQARINACQKFYAATTNEKYKKLVSGLDDESVDCVASILARIKLVSERKLDNGDNVTGVADIFSQKEKDLLDELRSNFSQKILPLSDGNFAYKQYILPIKHFEASVFYYKHQINLLNDIYKLKNKDFIDVGGFIGDSALIFTEYTSGKIYSFEAVSKNYENMLKTIELNNTKNIIPIKLGLGSKEEQTKIKIQGSGSTLTPNTFYYREDLPEEVISISTLDNFVDGKDLDIGLIKVDIEGFEQEFLKGAEKTIRKHKPAMLLSIYHNPSDFFDIKPMIDSWNLGYKFKISHPVIGSIYGETLLICECD